MNYLIDWKKAQLTRVGVYKVSTDIVWRKPREGWVKMNTDAAVFTDESIGLCCVMRNSQGDFVVAKSYRMEGSWTPQLAEGIGMKEAMSWVITQRIEHRILDTDSHVLAAACNDAPGEGIFGTILQDSIQLMKHINLVLVTFSYLVNWVGHELEKTTYSMSDAWGGLILHLT